MRHRIETGRGQMVRCTLGRYGCNRNMFCTLSMRAGESNNGHDKSDIRLVVTWLFAGAADFALATRQTSIVGPTGERSG